MSELISYPIPIRGEVGSLYLPIGLTRAEAERLKAIIDTLVTEGEETEA